VQPAAKSGLGVISITAGTGRVSELKLAMPVSRYSKISGDGALKITGDSVVWQPPAAGGTLRYSVLINSKRGNGAFDALITPNWAIFRGDKVFPKAKVKARGRSISELVLTAPKGWHVNTGFDRTSETQFRFSLFDAQRKFDAPKGWMIAGEIANRAEIIDNCKVIIAGPEGLGMRRQDMLALLNYTLPELKRAFGRLPKQLLIVAGPDPMWRGGLSAPNSLFLHMDRPMISENGTSALLHELTHAITRIRGEARADWIAEGMAEFYSIEALRRSGGMTDMRYTETLNSLKNWAKNVKTLTVVRSSGETTARAALLMTELDQEIRKATGNKRTLDDVTRLVLASGKKVSTAEFKAAAAKVLGRTSKTLETPLLR
jgi:predicted metalloprotease with PDZ domain